jgi:hypothetical protein
MEELWTVTLDEGEAGQDTAIIHLWAIAALADTSGSCLGGYRYDEDSSIIPIAMRLNSNGGIVWSAEYLSIGGGISNMTASSSGVIVASMDSLVGIDSGTGDILWDIANVPNAIISDGNEFVAVGYRARTFIPIYGCEPSVDVNALAIRISEDGRILDSLVRGRITHDEFAVDVCTTGFNNYVMVGNYDFECPFIENFSFGQIASRIHNPLAH